MRTEESPNSNDMRIAIDPIARGAFFSFGLYDVGDFCADDVRNSAQNEIEASAMCLSRLLV